ncbi:LPS O-antigen chain length determinant protein WzzB [Pollutimonas thiosulfatoxidans]|uniref:LPS O-antigen chain length determinant protein WzzB n=1 Tax=Pollutimonas thiosulfatoxidans TaxID=2028345 RepID=UPI0013E3C359|nr:Wzz/FepE/Etk N-terminal domain-containing protein [Pollutimonas thiosulfatoxidans]
MEQNQSKASLSDEVDIRELVTELWARKLFVLVCTVFLTGAALGYALLVSPTYEASAHATPPATMAVKEYNLFVSAYPSVFQAGPPTGPFELGDVNHITPDLAYGHFVEQLSSHAIRRKFFEKHYFPSLSSQADSGTPDAAWQTFNSSLVVETPIVTGGRVTTVTMRGADPSSLAEWANRFVKFTISETNALVLASLTSKVDGKVQAIDRQIEAVREVARKARLYRITRLHDALAIAESIGLIKPPPEWPIVFTTGDSTGATPALYLRGASALNAELEQLEHREQDDAYIPELPLLLTNKTLLATLNPSEVSIEVASLETEATTPKSPVEPRKKRIVLAGMLLGLSFGAFLVISSYLFRLRKPVT